MVYGMAVCMITLWVYVTVCVHTWCVKGCSVYTEMLLWCDDPVGIHDCTCTTWQHRNSAVQPSVRHEPLYAHGLQWNHSLFYNDQHCYEYHKVGSGQWCASWGCMYNFWPCDIQICWQCMYYSTPFFHKFPSMTSSTIPGDSHQLHHRDWGCVHHLDLHL